MTQDVGTYRKYKDIKFQEATMDIIVAARGIMESYERQGYALTLRQLYYQFVAKQLLANEQKNYDKLGSIVSDGRVAGLLSWTAIEDRVRNLQGYTTYAAPGEALTETAENYKIDMWQNQDWRPEVWIEKDALAGVIESICLKLRVNFFACKGYNSQSEQWRAGRRFADYYKRGQRPIVFHLGDHDPSGIDMTRDNRERLSMFAGTPVLVERLALNKAQIDHYGPPPNPTKLSDSRAPDYVRKFGHECWELDALTPNVIQHLISEALLRIRNVDKWNEMVQIEEEDKEALRSASENMPHGDD